MNLKGPAFCIMAALFALLQFFACKTFHRNRPVPVPQGFDWQGHRGARGLLPENSIPAFLKALEYPEVTTLELDLAVSKDHQLIVSHEPWFNPAICLLPNGDSIKTSEAGKYLIYERTAEEIAAFDCGSKGNPRFRDQRAMKTHKPTLKAVVQAVKTHYPHKKIAWNIEIKSEPGYDGTKTPPIEVFVDLVIQELRALGIDQQCNVQSFDVRPLQIMHRKAPEIRLAYLIENAQALDQNMEKLGFTPYAYSPYYMLVDRKLVKNCHKKGMKIIPWTVNDVASMRQLIKVGVDGIITDYPNLIERVNP